MSHVQDFWFCNKIPVFNRKLIQNNMKKNSSSSRYVKGSLFSIITEKKVIFPCFIFPCREFFFLSNLYTLRGTRIYNPEIESHALLTERTRQPKQSFFLFVSNLYTQGWA